ncbi:hypothetical protein BOTBODRAFT_36912 [Botryobasidium botryosum FD-172 SS1]|uniref:Uncharacterized protein n=1 Tax=Botryobasidium botryosum (strain FD-172 SS1) TaxID=930990 RepID=A0A067MD44_BOTB1|nr:hypothetical protein BOTBODRAFT_36912 [Botryobasidium botryosum FD-172 SS1]
MWPTLNAQAYTSTLRSMGSDVHYWSMSPSQYLSCPLRGLLSTSSLQAGSTVYSTHLPAFLQLSLGSTLPSLSRPVKNSPPCVAQHGCPPDNDKQLTRVRDFIRQVWGALVAISAQSKLGTGVNRDVQASLYQAVYSHTAGKALRRIGRWWDSF